MYCPATRWLNAQTYHLNDAIVAVSQGVLDSTLRYVDSARLLRPPVVIPNGVDCDRLDREALPRNQAREALGLPQDALIVGNIGNLFIRKGHVFLLQAAAKLARIWPKCHFAIIGDGDQAHSLVKLRRSLDLEKRVSFLTSTPHAARYLRAFDVFVLPSLFEGLPIALLEAMTLQLPCVATRVGGVPEVIEHGTSGLLTFPRDIVGLTAALDQLIGDLDLRLAVGESARERVLTTFTLSKMVEAYRGLYGEVVRPFCSSVHRIGAV